MREAVSARLDGDRSGVPVDALAAHLGCCPACAAWRRAAREVDRAVYRARAEPTPDLTDRILLGHRRARALRLDLLLRRALGLLAAVQVAVAAPDVFGHAHATAELGTWQVAAGAGFLAVARRPGLAGPALPMLVCASLATTFVSTRHILLGRATVAYEAAHLLFLAGVGLIVALWARRDAGLVGDDESCPGR